MLNDVLLRRSVQKKSMYIVLIGGTNKHQNYILNDTITHCVLFKYHIKIFINTNTKIKSFNGTRDKQFNAS